MSDSHYQSSSRPLAPAPGRLLKRNASSDELVPARKHKTTACKACKRKKLKCRGDPPCQHCVSHGVKCEVDAMSDMRRKYAMDRKVAKLEKVADTLTRLINALRDSESRRVSQLLNLIRSNASFDELQLFLEQQFSHYELESTPELRDIQSQLSQTTDLAPLGWRYLRVDRLADDPVYKVPAKPWTAVTDDSELVSHLVSLWLTWTYPWFNWLDADCLIKHMQEGKLNSRFCSPFLVNAILAEACYYSDYEEVFTVPGDLLTRGDQFFDEARRLFEAGEDEGDSPSLPTIQGLMILFVRTSMMGKDRMGWVYLDLAARGAQEYAASHPPHAMEDAEERRAIDRTLWGIFSMASTASVSLMKHFESHPPQQSPITRIIHQRHKDDVWQPYPRSTDAGVPSHISCVFNRWCAIACIAVEISRAIYCEEDRIPRAEMLPFINVIYQKLQDWYADMPECLLVENVTVPHALSLHLFYHTTVMQIFGLLKANHEHLDPASIQRARNICIESALRIAGLIGIHRDKWGIGRMAPSTIQWLSIGMFTLLDALDSPDTRNRAAFIEMCIVARAFARRFPLAKGILRMIQLSANQMQVVLPAETDALFTDFETRSWEGKDRHTFSTFYPNFARVVRQGAAREEDVSMDRFLEKWDSLAISDPKEETPPDEGGS
ncbi:C6 transcription factor, putative [Aspergillus fumigatus A1163]|uniref:C6 transcription factor, putative n=1 Tax=Aspergillus fumigatus (strain CBS 144.89 / FGSC A1163 / CEA10) TaxID=451804 RepID=B0YDR4_ASPFC|nr:C6 transcription factor, putative [Aspergillus fumigatus A1163]